MNHQRDAILERTRGDEIQRTVEILAFNGKRDASYMAKLREENVFTFLGLVVGR